MGIISSLFGTDSENFFNMFGGIRRSVLGTNSGKFNMNRNYVPINQKVILIDTSFDELIGVAQNVPHLNTVISRGAEMFSQGKIKHLDKKGEEIIDSPVLKLLNKPNPLQSGEGFLYEFYVNNAIYSSNFGYMNKGSRLKELPDLIWWLPPGRMKINLTGKMYRQTTLEGIIENYMLTYDNDPFMPEEIIHITEGISQNKLKPTSKIEALQIPLSNIVAALKSLNIIITERGLIGFISGDNRSTNGMGMEMTAAERKTFEKQYQKDRSLDSDQSHVALTQANMKWVPMTFDVKQLQLMEGLEDSFAMICGAYGIDRDVFPSTKGATNENKEMGLKATIQNTMQPLASKLMAIFEEHLNVSIKGESLTMDWSHMPVMQEDALFAAQAKYQLIQGLSLAKSDGIIGPDQYAEIAEFKMDGTGESESKIIQNNNFGAMANKSFNIEYDLPIINSKHQLINAIANHNGSKEERNHIINCAQELNLEHHLPMGWQ